MKLKLAITAAVFAVSTVAVAPAPASGQQITDPLYINWALKLPAYELPFDQGSADECVAGRDSCFVKTVQEMEKLLDGLTATCSHNAMFALDYTRISQGYSWFRTTGVFDDTAAVNYLAEVFARTYLKWREWWSSTTHKESVPPAWKVAFVAADGRTVSGTGDQILGISAHINRDLPFVLAATGLVNSDGTSRKPDFDRVNDLLYMATRPLSKETDQRLDSDMESSDEYNMANPATFNLIAGWRERAWRNAEDLLSARDQKAFEVVAQRIEMNAEAEGLLLAAETAYLPPLTSTAKRDAYCAVHNGDPAPEPYPFNIK